MQTISRLVFTLLLVATLGLAAPPPTELLRWVPADAEVVMAVDAAALRAHPLVQGWILEHQASWTGIDSEMHRFMRDAGLDPLHDVDFVLVAAKAQGQDGSGLALFAGRYNCTRVGAALVARGAVVEMVNGAPLYLAGNECKREGVALPSAELILAGDEAAVRRALAGPATGRTLISGAVAAGHIDLRAPFWLVAAVPEELRQSVGRTSTEVKGEHADTVRSVLAAGGTILRVAMQAHLDTELTLSGVAVTDTAESAELLRDAVKGALAAARLELQQSKPELVEVLREAEVTVHQTEVSGQIVFPLTLIEQLVRAKGTKATGTTI